MKGMLEEKIKNKNDPHQYVKKLLAIQKLDAFNFMHSKGSLHKGIEIHKHLIQKINRLYDIGLASVISILPSYKNSKKSIQAHFIYEVEKEFFRIQVKDNLQVFRLVTLELDNQNILQRQSILHEELAEIYQEKKILSKFKVQLTPKSNILMKDKAYLIQNYQKTRLTAELIINTQPFRLDHTNPNGQIFEQHLAILGGSEKQKIQDCQLDDQQIQCNQNQSKRIKIEDQLLIEQIQNSISLFEHMQTQSVKQVEKPQQNENQQFQENKNQNQNQSEALITQIDDSIKKKSEQDQTFKKAMVKKNEKVQIEVNIESNQNKNQDQNENEIEIEQFNINENQNYNQNQLEDQTIKTDNGKQKILQDLPFKNGVGINSEQTNSFNKQSRQQQINIKSRRI
ncbi:hypothetical protein ABPG73_016978 [Tetrahymena malaccensis]